MQIDDIGEMPDGLVVFGGPYSNLHALDALIAQVGGAPALCTGDIVAYCGRPEETAQKMRATGWPIVAGNCERQIAEGAEDCGCGFSEGSACDMLSSAWFPFAQSRVSSGTKAWMAGLPDAILVRQGGRRYAVIHGGVTDVARFLWPSDSDAVFASELAAIEARVGEIDGVIAGHCGIAFDRVIGRHRWINAGVIGMPPHDGRRETRFAVLTGGEPVFHRLSYDAEAARAAMAAAGLPSPYGEALVTGLWPSEDVLPEEMRR